MVQIIEENRRPTFMQRLSKGLGPAIETAEKSYEDYIRSKREAQEAEADAELFEKYGIPKSASKEFKKMLLASQLKREEEGLKPKKGISLKDVRSNFENIYGKEFADTLQPEDWERLHKRINDLSETMTPDEAFIQAGKEFENPEETTPEMQKKKGWLLPDYEAPKEEQAEGKGFFHPFKQGLEHSISGRIPAIMQGEPHEEYEKRLALGEKPSFLERLMHTSGEMAGNLPYMIAGGKAGAMAGGAMGAMAGPEGVPVGAIVGGGAGAMAIPAMLDKSLDLYHQEQSKGFKGNLEDYINYMNQVAQTGILSAAEGAIFASLSKALPLLKGNPKMKKLLESTKIPDKALTGAIESTGLLASHAASKGELPTSNEVADTFAQILGLNLAGALPEKLYKKVAKSGQNPKEVAEKVAKEIETKGIDPRDKAKIENVVNAVVVEGMTPEKEQALSIFDAMANQEKFEPAKEAEALAERPVEKTIKAEEARKKKAEKPLTEKEQQKRDIAREEANEIQTEIEAVKNDIEDLHSELNRPGQKDKKLYEHAIQAKENELAKLQKEYDNKNAIAERGVEPFSKEALEEPIAKHMAELEEAGTNPESQTAKEWKEMFDRDQKYVDDFEEMLEKKELPEAKYIDRYIKLLDAYSETYNKFLDHLDQKLKQQESVYEQMNKRTKLARQTKAEIERLRRLKKIAKQNDKINRSKVGLQKDKLAQLRSLKKPGSALTRQILKKIRSDIPHFKKNFIEQIKQLETGEKKAQEIFKKQTQMLDKMIKDYQKNPSEMKLKQIGEEAGMKPEETKKAKTEGEKAAKEMVEAVKEGETEKGFTDKLLDKLEKVMPKSKIGKAVFMAILSNELLRGVKMLTGLNIPVSTVSYSLGAALPKGAANKLKGGFYTFGLASVYEQIKDKISDWRDRSEYQNLKTNKERREFIQKLRTKGLSAADIKKITQ